HFAPVNVKAVFVNPIDYRVRSGSEQLDARLLVLGYDASGIVEDVGEDITLFKKGDEVIYAGVLGRQGSNASHQLVGERIVAIKPNTWTHEDAAALPLVSLTAWEGLIENLGIPISETENPKSLLYVPTTHSVGSLALTLASKVLKLKTIMATASRPATIAWVKKFGATHVINHNLPFSLPSVHYRLNVVSDRCPPSPLRSLCGGSTEKNVAAPVPLINPTGNISLIVPVECPLPFQDAFYKAVSLHWIFMFTKPLTDTRPETQGQILKEIAVLADSGVISRYNVTESHVFGEAALKSAHESGKAIGKIVLVRA
ncbi:zinc-binding alcohol dehydrogenase family protein, partial [Blyttiomyces helicus]